MAKWYYVIVGRTVGIYNEWYVPTPSGTVFPLTCLRADAAPAVNKITGNIYKSCDFEYDCYRAFKMALLSGHVVIVNTRQ